MNLPKASPAERATDIAIAVVAVFGFDSLGPASCWLVAMAAASCLIFHWDWIFE
jgi:hypothetical protein